VSRVPVHIVTGSDRALASALMGRCAAMRPDWAVLELLSCPCCVGRPELQVKLAQLLRERRPARVLIGLCAAAHRAALERVLASWPLAQYVLAARALSVPEDAAIAPEALEGS
jgi:hypothetical protein